MVSEVMPGPSFGPGGQEGSKTQAPQFLSDPPAPAEVEQRPGDALGFRAKDHGRCLSGIRFTVGEDRQQQPPSVCAAHPHHHHSFVWHT